MARMMRRIVDPPGTIVEERHRTTSRFDEDGNEREPEWFTIYSIGEKDYYTGSWEDGVLVLRDFLTGKIDATVRYEPIEEGGSND